MPIVCTQIIQPIQIEKIIVLEPAVTFLAQRSTIWLGNFFYKNVENQIKQSYNVLHQQANANNAETQFDL
jgi:hypothetical protein